MTNVLYALIGLAIGLILSVIYNFVKNSVGNKTILKSTELANKIIEDAKQKVDALKKTTILEAKEEWYQIKKKLENEINTRKNELHSLEKKYNDRVLNLDRRLENLDKKDSHLQEFEKRLNSKEVNLKSKEQELDSLIEQQNTKLSEIAKLSREEAIQILKNNLKIKPGMKQQKR